jgi:hypothetical protein
MIGALLLALTVAPLAPEPASLTARVTPAEVTVGDRVRVEIDVELPAGSPEVQPAPPPAFRRWGQAEVLAIGDAQRLPGDPDAPRYRLQLVLAAFAPGAVELPPTPLLLTPVDAADSPTRREPERVLTPPGLGFTVRSVLPASGEVTPQPPAPPRSLPAGSAFWWAAGALAFAAAAAAALLLLRPRHPVAAAGAGAPALPPLAGLLRELALLRGEGSAERLHTRLSAAVRRFLAALLGIAAGERTTSEIDRELRGGPLAAETRRGLVDLLRRCDEVKFARRPATAEEALSRLAHAAELARAAEQEARPEPEADLGDGEGERVA